MRFKFYTATMIGVLGVLSLTMLGLVPQAPKPGVVFEIETTYHSESRVESSTMSVHGSNLKIEVLPGDNAGKDEVKDEVIFRGDKREMVVVDHSDEAYMVVDKKMIEELLKGLGDLKKMTEELQLPEEVLQNLSKEQREQLEKAQKQMGQLGQSETAKATQPKDEYKKTGERGTKGGYPCVKYEVIRDGQKIRELWVTDWGNVEGSDEVKNVFGELEVFFKELTDALEKAMGGKGGLFEKEDNPFDGFFGVDGFPVVTREFEGGELESESVLRSATRRALDPAEFEPPSGYKRRSMGPQ